MNTRHERPVALITGAGKRVGAVIARTLHAAGYDLALHYRSSAADAELLAASLERQRSGSTCIVQAELADLDALPGVVQRALDRFGRLDALVNNASAFYPTPVGTATQAQWNELFASNARRRSSSPRRLRLPCALPAAPSSTWWISTRNARWPTIRSTAWRKRRWKR